MARDVFLAYPDFNEGFKMYTNASYFQLVNFIRKNGIPISFYSIKVTEEQKRYTVTEKELIVIVENLK